MKKEFLFLTILCLLATNGLVFSQSDGTTIKDLERTFVRSQISEKKDIIPTAVSLGKDGSKLIAKSLQFVIDNHTLLGAEDVDLYNLALAAASESWQYVEMQDIVAKLIELFSLYDDSAIRTALFIDFSKIKTYSISSDTLSSIIKLTDNFVSESSSLFFEKDATFTDNQKNELAAAIKTLENFADSSSFSILFKYIVNCSNKEINEACIKALNNISGSYKENVIKILENNPPLEKLLVYRISIANEKISSFFHAEIAEKALSVAINNIGDITGASQELIDLQVESMKEIAKASWTKADLLSVRSFNLAQQELNANRIDEQTFISIINCLQSLASVETSQALSSYLNVLNTNMEKTSSYSETIMLAVINALGALGDKSSFDYLLAVTYLDYSQKIIEAARNALADIKW